MVSATSGQIRKAEAYRLDALSQLRRPVCRCVQPASEGPRGDRADRQSMCVGTRRALTAAPARVQCAFSVTPAVLPVTTGQSVCNGWQYDGSVVWCVCW